MLSIVIIESANTESAISGLSALSFAVIETAICPSELSTNGRLYVNIFVVVAVIETSALSPAVLFGKSIVSIGTVLNSMSSLKVAVITS